MLTYLLFIFGFFILIKGADLLIEGSSSLAKKYKISNIVIGLTIVAFGTSAPEFVVNIIASYNNNGEIVLGNILGSNIANILLILGVSSIIYPITTSKNTVIKEIPFTLLAILMVGILSNDILIDGGELSMLSRIDGLVLLSFFIIFIYYTFGITKSYRDLPDENIEILTIKNSFIYIILGLLGLIFGGKWIVDGAIFMAQNFNISESLIGLTMIAIGTSLPELATSAVASYKKQSDIAIGNVVGSNIFNIFWVLGISSFISPITLNSRTNIDISMTILSSIILLICMYVGKKFVIERWQGIFMIFIYIFYIFSLIFIK